MSTKSSEKFADSQRFVKVRKGSQRLTKKQSSGFELKANCHNSMVISKMTRPLRLRRFTGEFKLGFANARISAFEVFSVLFGVLLRMRFACVYV